MDDYKTLGRCTCICVTIGVPICLAFALFITSLVYLNRAGDTQSILRYELTTCKLEGAIVHEEKACYFEDDGDTGGYYVDMYVAVWRRSGPDGMSVTLSPWATHTQPRAATRDLASREVGATFPCYCQSPRDASRYPTITPTSGNCQMWHTCVLSVDRIAALKNSTQHDLRVSRATGFSILGALVLAVVLSGIMCKVCC